MEFRNLEINDYYRGYLDLLSQLHRQLCWCNFWGN